MFDLLQEHRQTGKELVAALNVKDLFIALLEDLVTIGLAFFFATRWPGFQRFSFPLNVLRLVTSQWLAKR